MSSVSSISRILQGFRDKLSLYFGCNERDTIDQSSRMWPTRSNFWMGEESALVCEMGTVHGVGLIKTCLDLFSFNFFSFCISHWEGWGAVLSGLLSWLLGGLVAHGLLLPSAGELLKSSSSSRPLVASYCVFSSLVIRRSSSSPNSPPIKVGSPTTITSCRNTTQRRREGRVKSWCSAKKTTTKLVPTTVHCSNCKMIRDEVKMRDN